MAAVLNPGVRLLDRFSFSSKFQLLFLLFILPLCYALWVMVSTCLDQLHLVERERAGMRVVQKVYGVQAALVDQRTLFARWKGTEKDAQAPFEQSAGTLDDALRQVGEQLDAEGLGEKVAARFKELQDSRALVDVAVLGKMALPDGMDRYRQVLALVQRLRDQVSIDSGLMLDPWLDTYLLMDQLTVTLPGFLESLGNFVSNGHGAVLSQHFTLQSRLAVRDLRRVLDDYRARLEKARSSLADDAPALMASLQGDYDQAFKSLDDFLATLDKQIFDASPIAMTPAQFVQAVEGERDQLQALQQRLYQVFDARQAGYRGDAIARLVRVLCVYAVLTLAALYILLCLNASIRRGTAGITAAAASLRDGDLRVRLEVHGRDDLAKIAESLNAAVAQLRDSLQGVNRESRQLGDTVKQLNAQAEGSLGEVEQQQGQVSQIAAAATQLAATAQSVAQSCEEAAADAGQTREIAVQSNQRSARTSDSMRQLSARLGDTAGALRQLREQTQQITRVVDVIKGIAEQTNLLALNAAIEAARAGEQGRGFAVVADEVRSLSQRTQESTKEIGQTVDDLQRVVGQAVSLMEEAYRQAETDVGSVLEMGGDLESIAEAVQRVSDRLAQIATAAEQQAATADEVSGNIQQVDQAASHLLAGAQAVSAAAEQLRQGSQGLERNTGRFRLE